MSSSLISSNYVEKADVDKVMNGAMHGLADRLDPDSAYLTADQVKQIESGAPLPAGDVGIDLTRQYYLRIIAARDNSPAAKAGLRTGDYVRAINDKPTREMSVFEGMRALRGTPGSKVKLTIIRGNATDPHVVELTRETPPASDVTGRMAAPGIGYLRIAAIGPKTADQVKSQIADLTKAARRRLSSTCGAPPAARSIGGIALARLFVASGTLACGKRRAASARRSPPRPGDGVDHAADHAAGGHRHVRRRRALRVGTRRQQARRPDRRAHHRPRRTAEAGEAARRHRPVADHDALPHPDRRAAHEKGLEPTVLVDEPDVEFGQPAPTDDPILDKALDASREKAA